MIFADASALIAIITHEADAVDLIEALQSDQHRICSPLSAWEAMAGLTHAYMFSVETARQRVRLFIDALGIRFVAIGESEWALASDAYSQFGKGRHPARLNMGDCFAYACARTHNARLLFNGKDFGKTDITPALARS